MGTGTIIVTEDDECERPQKVAIYTRVSAAENRPNLDTQAERLLAYCAASETRSGGAGETRSPTACSLSV